MILAFLLLLAGSAFVAAVGMVFMVPGARTQFAATNGDDMTPVALTFGLGVLMLLGGLYVWSHP